MLFRLPETTRRRLGNAILVGLALCLLGAMWGTVLRVRQSMDEGREEVRRAGQQIVEALDHELDIHLYNLHAMRYLAERFLSGQAVGLDNPVTRLVAVSQHGGYESVAGLQGEDLRLVGASPVWGQCLRPTTPSPRK